MEEYIRRQDIIDIVRKNASTKYDWSEEIDVDDFEKVLNQLPSADVMPVRHGHWIHTDKHLWYRAEDGEIDFWRLDCWVHNGPECRCCHKTICINCNTEWDDDKCEEGHWICSVCGGPSIEGHEKYCSSCGAQMDGGANGD